MRYIVSKKRTINRIDCTLSNCILLIKDDWNDFGYVTTFNGYYYDLYGKVKSLGSIKIGYTSYGESWYTFDYMPKEFSKLPTEFFSLWQSSKSYSLIKDIQDTIFEDIFSDLNDIAYDLKKMKEYKNLSVSDKSLFRFVSKFTCQNQFHRISNGQAELTNYSFNYCLSNNSKYVQDLNLSFNVIPDSYPPTNVHVLIGRNGVGKTNLFSQMISDIYNFNQEKFTYIDDIESDQLHFESIMHISFSPFDNTIIERKNENNADLKYNYLGFNKSNLPTNYSKMNVLEILETQMTENFKICLSNKSKFDDWIEAVGKLNSDVVFSSLNFNAVPLLKENMYENNIINKLLEKYNKLSSGHKAVLTIVTSIVAKLAEQTIVFIDEPENHLHPPLLSTMMRVISSLLRKRNAVAIIATHSSIVLQEVPSSCVWLLSRSGTYLTARRPTLETFGANVGSLINEVFGYEIQESGFHKVLASIVSQYDSYEDVLNLFDNQLGDDARSLLRLLYFEKGL